MSHPNVSENPEDIIGWRERNDCKGRVLVKEEKDGTVVYVPIESKSAWWNCILLHTTNPGDGPVRGDIFLLSNEAIFKSKELFPVIRHDADVRIYFA